MRIRLRSVEFSLAQQDQLREHQPHTVYKVKVLATSADPNSWATVQCPPTQPLLEFLASIRPAEGWQLADIPVGDMWLAVDVNVTTAYSDPHWDGLAFPEAVTLLPTSADQLVCETVQRLNHAPQPPDPSVRAAKFNQDAARSDGQLQRHTTENLAEHTRWNARVAASVIAIRCCCDNSSAMISQIAQVCAINTLPLAAFLPRPLPVPQRGHNYESYFSGSGYEALCGYGTLYVGYNNEQGLPYGAPVTVAVEYSGIDNAISVNVQATMSTSLGLFLRLLKREGITLAGDWNSLEVKWNGEEHKLLYDYLANSRSVSSYSGLNTGPSLGHLGATNGSVLVINEEANPLPRPQIKRGRPFTSAGLVASGERKMTNVFDNGHDCPWVALSVTQVLNGNLERSIDKM